MSIQGSVNQLFAIGGSFAGMYGLLHPEIAQARQIIHDLKGAKTADKLSRGYSNAAQDYQEEANESTNEKDFKKNSDKMTEYEDKASKYENIANNAETNIQKRIEENPSLLANKKVLKAYEDKADYDRLMRSIAKKQKAQVALETEGMSKVEQNANYEKRRKDKGDI